MTDKLTPSPDIETLIAVMKALRTPVTGCPWDLEQTFKSVVRYTIEEAYEVADAIERNNMSDLKDELGDLLLQVVFHARMAEEQGAFAFGDVVKAITAKMIRRHPHVFSGETSRTTAEVNALWQRIKAEERAMKGERPAHLLDAVPVTFPALKRAQKLQDKAGTVGFDWNDPRAVLAKIQEEAAEVTEAALSGDQDAVEDEIGDILFAAVNLARHLKVDADKALSRSNAKFVRRFNYIEDELQKAGISLGNASLDEMEALWQQAKTALPPD